MSVIASRSRLPRAKKYLTQGDVVGPPWENYVVLGTTTAETRPPHGFSAASGRAYWSLAFPVYGNAYDPDIVPQANVGRYVTPWSGHVQARQDALSWIEPYSPILQMEHEVVLLNADYFREMNAWLEPTISRLNALVHLGAELDSRESASVDSAMEALTFFALALPATSAPPSVSPLNDGGVQAEWHRGGIDVEVIFSPNADERGIYVRDKATGDEQEIPLDPEAFRSIVSNKLDDIG